MRRRRRWRSSAVWPDTRDETTSPRCGHRNPLGCGSHPGRPLFDISVHLRLSRVLMKCFRSHGHSWILFSRTHPKTPSGGSCDRGGHPTPSCTAGVGSPIPPPFEVGIRKAGSRCGGAGVPETAGDGPRCHPTHPRRVARFRRRLRPSRWRRGSVGSRWRSDRVGGGPGSAAPVKS